MSDHESPNEPGDMISRGQTAQGFSQPSDLRQQNGRRRLAGRRSKGMGLRLVSNRAGISARAFGVAKYRQGLLWVGKRIRACLQVPKKVVLNILGISSATYSRWNRAYQANGVRGLAPHSERSGRRPAAGRPRGNDLAGLTIPLMILPQRRRNGRLMLGVKLGPIAKKVGGKANA